MIPPLRPSFAVLAAAGLIITLASRVAQARAPEPPPFDAAAIHAWFVRTYPAQVDPRWTAPDVERVAASYADDPVVARLVASETIFAKSVSPSAPPYVHHCVETARAKDVVSCSGTLAEFVTDVAHAYAAGGGNACAALVGLGPSDRDARVRALAEEGQLAPTADACAAAAATASLLEGALQVRTDETEVRGKTFLWTVSAEPEPYSEIRRVLLADDAVVALDARRAKEQAWTSFLRDERKRMDAALAALAPGKETGACLRPFTGFIGAPWSEDDSRDFGKPWVATTGGGTLAPWAPSNPGDIYSSDALKILLHLRKRASECKTAHDAAAKALVDAASEAACNARHQQIFGSWQAAILPASGLTAAELDKLVLQLQCDMFDGCEDTVSMNDTRLGDDLFSRLPPEAGTYAQRTCAQLHADVEASPIYAAASARVKRKELNEQARLATSLLARARKTFGEDEDSISCEIVSKDLCCHDKGPCADIERTCWQQWVNPPGWYENRCSDRPVPNEAGAECAQIARSGGYDGLVCKTK